MSLLSFKRPWKHEHARAGIIVDHVGPGTSNNVEVDNDSPDTVVEDEGPDTVVGPDELDVTDDELEYLLQHMPTGPVVWSKVDLVM